MTQFTQAFQAVTNSIQQAARQKAAHLINQVIDEELSCQVALNRWPTGNEVDSSLEAAYQALWYFEGDEDRHQQEMYYLDAQLALLNQIAFYLAQGQDLPPYLLRGYASDKTIHFYEEKGLLLEPLFRLNGLLHIIKQSLLWVETPRAALNIKKAFSVWRKPS